MRSAAFWSLIVAFLLTACGGAQSGRQAEAPTAPVMEPEPEPEPEPEHVYYEVFWQDIHVMTIYARPGPLRSEESDSADDVFSGRSRFMSVASHYVEREPEMARLVERAQSLDDFLAIVTAEGYEVEALTLEEGY